MLQQSHVPLTNGIVSFLEASEDYDLAPIGIGSMHKQAQKLAEFGRHGDIYFVHAAKGETVIPLEVLNANPKVKDMLFNQMREMGLDPEEFVVGNELNSINPVTGMPEFFFSSVWRSVKRAASSAWKGIKKAAPYVLPLVLSAFGVPFLSSMAPSVFGAGSFGAAFLGSGIGTLAAGGSMKDALKTGAMAGVGSAVWSGVTSIGSPEGFMGGVKQSFYNPNAADFTTQLGRFTEALKPQGKEGSFAEFWKGEKPAIGPTPPPQISPQQSVYDQAQAEAFGGRQPSLLGGADELSLEAYPSFDTPAPPPGQQAVTRQAPAPVVQAAARQAPTPVVQVAGTGAIEKPSLYEEYIGKYISGGGETAEHWTKAKDLAGNKAYEAVMLRAEGAGVPKAAAFKAAEAARTAAMTKVGPGPLATYGPTAGLGLLAAYAGGAFKAPKIDQPERPEGFVSTTGAKLIEEDPGKYLVANLNPFRYDTGNPLVPTTYSAQGGLAEYPPRDLLVEGPGTERSDEIPAMLSDGEFVMNAKSVRGADPSGGGNRYAGANNLYKMMRNFEMRS